MTLGFTIAQDVRKDVNLKKCKVATNAIVSPQNERITPISNIKCPYFFDLTSFRKLGQKSWKKIVGFLEDLKTPNGHFKIN